jgi:hypothetical protein
MHYIIIDEIPFFYILHISFTFLLHGRFCSGATQKRSCSNQKNNSNPMKKKIPKKKLQVEKREQAMIEGILEGSPDGIGVVVIRLECGCRKMAAVSKDGDPASEIIMYRDQAESICDKCKDDNGSFMRVKESFIHWTDPPPSADKQEEINLKVLGSNTSH